jgi:UDP-N-acetylmuramate--alanine ligase
MNKRFEVVHLVGIGGAGMSGIAEILKNLGYEIRGSDAKESEITRRLKTLGIHITIGHKAENVKGAHVVVISSAISPDNPEVLAARKLSIPVIPRAEMLAEIARLKYAVLVAGAHGKTTTTSLVASMLASGGLDPTVVIGGKLKDIGSHAKLGKGDFLVAEADESDGSFLKLSPTIAVVTNIDREHMDFFRSVDELKTAFLSFVNKVPFYGLSVLCADNVHIGALIPKIQRRFLTYGLNQDFDLVAKNIRYQGIRSEFEAYFKGVSLGLFEIPLPGIHNVYNCLATLGVAHELGLDMNRVREGLKNFSGVQRRFEFKGEISGIRVFDDYGHHPTEIIATLKAGQVVKLQNAGNRAQNTGENRTKGRFVVVFQPHRYTRTKDLLREFYGAFKDADRVVLMDIYPAGENPIEGVDSEILYRGMKNGGKDVVYLQDRDRVMDYLLKELKSGDLLLTLGAGNVWKIGEDFLKMKNQSSKIKSNAMEGNLL